MAKKIRRFIFSPDKHWGYENRHGRLIPTHSLQAINCMLSFARDFKPNIWIEGGDNLDFGPLSHWHKNKQLSLKNLDLSRDAQEYQKHVLDEINKLKPSEKWWMIGNHEDWGREWAEHNPGAQTLVDVRKLLDLKGWTVVEQGGVVEIGHLQFVHGDMFSNIQNVAKQAVERAENSIRFGHFHSYQAYTKHNMIHSTKVHTGVMVPGLCSRNMAFMENRPNQWLHGFCFGYINPDGMYSDYVPIIINGKVTIDGKIYTG